MNFSSCELVSDMTARRYLLILGLFFCQCVYAVDTNKLWLPKKYQSITPKLLQAALEAESSERCLSVIAGEMIIRKNSESHYYFVITCRDQDKRTYTLSYRYPVSGTAIDLVAEQLSAELRETVDVVTVKNTGVDEKTARLLCRIEISTSFDDLTGIEIIEGDISPVDTVNSGYSYTVPFFAKSELGSNVRYQAHCSVSAAGETVIELSLERQGAIAICRDSVRSEAAVHGRIHIDEEQITQIDNSAEYVFQLPFVATNQEGTSIDYNSKCTIKEQREADVVINLVASGALAICKDSLKSETVLMKSVVIAGDASQLISGNKGIFSMEIPFTAKTSLGKMLNFIAQCEIDEDGDTYVVTEIDRSTVASVCIDELNNQVRNMKFVAILEEKINVVGDADDGSYLVSIPFDARSPAGRQLKYEAECRLASSGRSRITLAARVE